MTPGGAWVSAPGVIPGEAELRELHRIRMRHLNHVIYREVDPQTKRVTYHAFGITIEIHPHTIVTRSLAELGEALAEGSATPAHQPESTDAD